MSIARFTRKEVVTAQPDETAGAVAAKMRSRHVGSVVIVDEGQPVGIVTDRDLALRIVAEGRPLETPIGEVMSRDLVTVRVTDTLDRIVLTMRERGVRRLPIVADDGALVGLVALDDLYVLLAGELAATAQALRENRGP